MAWFKVDDGFANSKPVLRIPRRYRAQAVGLWVMAGTWCAKELTDGFVPDYTIDDFASSPAMAAHLVRAGLWENTDGGWQFVGWANYQFTKEQVLARRSAEAEKKQRARDAAKKRSEQVQPSDVPRGHRRDIAGSPEGVPALSELPDQTRPDQTKTHLSLVTLGGDVALVDAPEPPIRCQSHILDPSPPRCGFCADARKANEAWAEQQQAQREIRKAQHRDAVNACLLCDDNGMLETAVGLNRCDHLAMSHA